MKNILLATTVFIMAFPCISHATENNFAIISSPGTAFLANGEGKFNLAKGEVVRIIKQNKDRVEVIRLENPPNWETLPNEEIKKEKQPLLVSSSKLVRRRLFRPVLFWDITQRPKYLFCEGSCDTGINYEFKSNGDFIATVGESNSDENSHPHKIHGHLYSYKGLYWARTKDKASKANVFYIQGQLFCNINGCETP